MPETRLQTNPPSNTARAWDDAELPHLHENAAKHDKVRAMFNAIARSYDLNNRLHSLWRDESWRKQAVLAAGVRPGERVLDCACGTGDLTRAFARFSKAAHIVGSDYTPGMLEVARHKRRKLHNQLASRISYQQADAQDLPYENASFDVVSIAFGIRNVQDPQRAVGEFARVLRPGGRLVILEFGQPAFPPVRWFNSIYCGAIMPRTATWIAHDRSGAYKYLPRSVASFKTRDEMMAMMRNAGLSGITARPLTLGICNLYRGQIDCHI